jgi:4-hydroxy-3-methylbut-2-enyl diphosphate reductase
MCRATLAAEENKMDVLLANPRGFCAGVDRAIAIVEQALTQFGAPIYVRHEVVHNKFVVDDLRAKGAVFVEELHEIPPGATVVFSAHGVSKAVRAEADARGLHVFDATCPLVTKVHVEIAKMRAQGREIVMIGHEGHPEVEGTMGQCEGGVYLVDSVADVAGLVVREPDRLAYVTQTTLSVDDAAAVVDALKQRFPAIVGPKRDDICYATQNRQDAVKVLAPKVDVVIVVGSPNSSNSNRLREVAAHRGIPAYMIDKRRRAETGVGRRQASRRRLGRRIGTGSAGARSRRTAEGARRAGRVRTDRRRRDHRVSDAERPARHSHGEGARSRAGSLAAARALRAKPYEQCDERRDRDDRRDTRDDRIAAVLGEPANDPLGAVPGQHQRQPLPRTARPARHAGQHEQQRQAFEHEP